MNKKIIKKELADIFTDIEIVPNEELENGHIELSSYNNIPWDDGLYKGDALGKVGTLAQAKDGKGSLGTIVDDNGKIIGQMRWTPVDGAPMNINATMPINPTTLVISAVVIEINMKLDEIQELQQEMFNYIKDIFYRNQIAKKVSKQDIVRFGANIEERVKSVEEDFKDYKLSLGMYSFAVYLEVLLNENFKEDYLRKKSTQIHDQNIKYRQLYTDTYNALKEYSTNTMEQKLLGGLSLISKGLGEALKNTPIGDATPIDSFLIDGGNSIKNFGNEISDNSVNRLIDSKDCDVRIFSDSIDKISTICNGSMEFLFTEDGLHFRELPS